MPTLLTSDGYALTEEGKKALERISVSYKDTMTIPLLRCSGGPSRVTTGGEITSIIVEYK